MNLISSKYKEIILKKLFINQSYYQLSLKDEIVNDWRDNQLIKFISLLSLYISHAQILKDRILHDNTHYDKNDINVYKFTTLSFKDCAYISVHQSMVDVDNIFTIMLNKIEPFPVNLKQDHDYVNRTIPKIISQLIRNNNLKNNALNVICSSLNDDIRIKKSVLQIHHHQNVSNKNITYMLDTLWNDLTKAVIKVYNKRF